jgi:predicted GNAT superfamily acetyltransferase
MIQYDNARKRGKMTAAVRRKKRKDEIKVTIAEFRNLEDYKTCEDIQRSVWHCQDIDVVPVPLLLEIHRTGGILLGAYSSLGDLIGFACSILGSANGVAVQHSCLLAVRMAYRNFDIGFKLITAQRKEALKQKVKSITSSFDPMLPQNAYFALGKLGAWSNAYEENYCGETTVITDRGMPTDRLTTYWNLESGAVVRRMETGPLRHDLRKELKRQPIINQLVETAPGLMNSSSVKMNCSEEHFLFEVPYNLPEIKNRDLGMALEWQSKMRQTFRHYFKKDYVANDFFVTTHDGHLRAFYRLEKKKS